MQNKILENLAVTLSENHPGVYAFDRKTGKMTVNGPVPFATFLLLLSRFGRVRVQTGWA